MEHLTYTELVEFLKAQGCTWVHHSNHWEGAGWIVDQRGRGIKLFHFHIDYPGTGAYYSADHPYFANMEIHRTDYESGFTVVNDGVETFPDYTPTTMDTQGFGYCNPIDCAVEFWKNKTAAFYEREGYKQPV